ncbi:MAG TPA: ATP-binding protein [Chitinophagaceae bacterium]|nr:ATP-binding protein [Chitinophagaceae bacterium]
MENRGKVQADKKAAQYSFDLEQNIQQLKQAANELDELKSIEKFAATGRIARTIAHEVRNPLTNITLATDQLQKMDVADPDSSMLLEMIGRNANRINQLVSDLLNATRLGQLDFATWELNDLVDETLKMAKDRIELNHVKVEKIFTSLPCKISVDAEKIKLALLNIIVNGIEAMENKEGLLQIKTSRYGDKSFLEIKDNGKGMDKDTLQKSFEPFFTAKSSGNGLGLTNTQNIILSHKGTMKVDSHPGLGTSFTVILNLSEPFI